MAEATVLQQGEGTVVEFGPHCGGLLSPGTTGGFHVSEWTLVPGADAPPLHLHREIDEVIYILAGEIELTDGVRTFIGRPGTFMNIPRGTPHGFGSFLADEPVRLLLVKSPADKALAVIEAMAEASTVSDPAKMMEILSRVDFVPVI